MTGGAGRTPNHTNHIDRFFTETHDAPRAQPHVHRPHRAGGARRRRDSTGRRGRSAARLARRVVDQFEIDARSGRRPGAAETLGAGAAAGTLATAAVVTAAASVGSEAFGDDVDADASRTADKIAGMLSDFFAQNGWIAPQ
jgi:hypothetical protein